MAEHARGQGNEGRARVCARRAVGAVLGEYFRRAFLPDPGSSAYDRLLFFVNHPETAENVRQTANLFLLKVDYDHKLPVQADLIAEAKWLANELLPSQFEEGPGKTEV